MKNVDLADIRIEEMRRRGEQWGDQERREALYPIALAEALRHEDSSRRMFEGLLMHYSEAICAGRLEIWAKAAHSMIDLMAYDKVQIVSRSSFPE